MKKSHVVHVVPALFGNDNVYGGAERYAYELARQMSEHTRVSLVTFGSRSEKRIINKLQIHIYKNWINFKRFKFDPINPCFLASLTSADVIHYHQSNTMMASAALLYALMMKKPIFSTYHGGAGYGLHRFINLTNYYNGHLHVSQFSRQVHGHTECSRARVILGGVDIDKYSPNEHIDKTGEVVYAGRLLPHKGINYLIEAVSNETPVTLVGRKAKYAEKYYSLLKKLAQGKKVGFIENADDEAMISIYRRALCVVLPSVHETVFQEYYSIPELLGLAVLEGMACGLPAIVTNICSLPEIVEDGISGFIIPPNNISALRNKIEWFQNNPAEARSMGIAARNRIVKTFNWEQVVDRCFKSYQEFGLIA